MKVPPHITRKLDPKLVKQIEEERGEPIRAIAKVGKREKSTAPSKVPRAKDFETRTEYRKALLRGKRAQIAEEDVEFHRRMEELGVTVKGEGLLGVVVLEGAPEALCAALEDEHVESAAADRKIELDK